ncbi:uncharacterized protein [Triticum aestivum]|uniref:uncharacterized protein n=1 Tax=Triticum aestivum TaxID=4565 RepID=UPI001D02BD3C|nr:uncharacterized protein LOC123167769 [Triticum aestivum]
MFQHPVRRRLAAAAWNWNRATATRHLGPGGVRQLGWTKAASDGHAASAQEKAHYVPPLFSAMRADSAKYSTTPDPKEEHPEPELEETPTFSWELQGLLNEDLYKDQMKRIPATFTSIRDYTRSFLVPLMEERRAGVRAALEGIGHAPVAKVDWIEEYRPLSDRSLLGYTLWSSAGDGDCYFPKDDDVVLLTHRGRRARRCRSSRAP